MTDKPIAISDAPPPPVERSAFDMMQMLIEQGADLEKMQKAMELQVQWEERQAKRAYFEAMAMFKANPPEVLKTQVVDYVNSKGKKTTYRHADHGDATATINAELSKYGLSASWKLEQTDALVCVTCILTHMLGYSESVKLCGPPDQSGGKDMLKAIGSTVSYLERYTLLAITGIAAKKQDPESPPPIERITPKQLSELMDIADSGKVDKDAFLKHLNLEEWEDMPAAWFTQAKAELVSLGVKP